MYEKVKELLVEELSIKAEDITPESELVSDLGINSLELADLVLLCEEKFDIEIGDDAAQKFVTVGDVAEYLEEIMNPRSMYAMIREGVDLTTEDKLVTLSTCVANKPNNRRLLQAVLVEEIEAEYRGTVNEDANEAED